MYHINDLVAMGAITKRQADFIKIGASTEDNRPVLCRADLAPNGMLASTNGYRLHVVYCNQDNMPVLSDHAGIILNAEKFGLSFFETHYGKAYGKYPDIKGVMPTSLNSFDCVSVYASDLKQGLNLCGVMARDNANKLTITMYTYGLVLKAVSTKRGDVEHVIVSPNNPKQLRGFSPTVKDLGAELVTRSYNYRYLLDALKNSNTRNTKTKASDILTLYMPTSNLDPYMIVKYPNSEDIAQIMQMSTK